MVNRCAVHPECLRNARLSVLKIKKKMNSKANLPQEKQTALGLYVTAQEAYAKWQAAPEQVKVLDVRTPERMVLPETVQAGAIRSK